jgi:hypothetical protein
MANPIHHHFSPHDLAALEWSQAVSINLKYETDSGSRIDRVPNRVEPGKTGTLNGYHEAHFPIGADEVGYILIPDSALELIKALRDTEGTLTV